MKHVRRWIDRLILSDHQWKRKYCPYLHGWLFEMTKEERERAFSELARRMRESQ